MMMVQPSFMAMAEEVMLFQGTSDKDEKNNFTTDMYKVSFTHSHKQEAYKSMKLLCSEL